MRSRCLVLSGSSAVLTSLSLWAPQLLAQDALAASVAVESSQLSLQAPPADTGAEGDYLHRYTPQANTVELGAFAGLLFFSDDNSFRGDPDANGKPAPYSEYRQPSAQLGVRVGYFPLTFLGGELEGMLGLAQSDRGNSGTLWAGRAQVVAQAPFWSVVPFLVGGAGYWALSNGTSGSDSDPAFHFGGGVKLAANDDLTFRIDMRDSITNQRAVGDVPHNLEVNAGASLVLGRSKPAPPDTDGDGVLNPDDACPREPGALPDGCPARDRDGDQIVDGDDQCPDQPGPAPTGCGRVDADADGIFDDNDQCLDEPGLAPSGCPDRDGDGVFDRQDQCPTVAGVAPLGCPGDTDQDGFTDPEDKCPADAETKNGFEDTDGCPDALPEAAKQFNGVIAGIEFDVSKDTIRTSSFKLLNQAAKLLQEYPSLRLQITGHTDDTGAHDRNLELSLARAESVKTYLVSQGVGEDRLQTRGAGPDEPLIKEKTRVARQKNRRIEFRVLQ